MEWTDTKTKLSQINEREMRDLRSNKREAVLTIPPVVRIVVVRVQPLTVIVAVSTEKVEVAVRNV